MDRKTKEQFVADMKALLQRAKATFLVDYQGLDVESMTRLRGELRKIDTEFQVVKNRLLALASEETETGALRDHFTGPCAIAITYDDVVAPAAVLTNMAKELEKLNIKAGQISGKVMDVNAVERLAKLPGRQELLAQLLAGMLAVPSSLARVLNGVLVQFLNVLKAIESKKQEQE